MADMQSTKSKSKKMNIIVTNPIDLVELKGSDGMSDLFGSHNVMLPSEYQDSVRGINSGRQSPMHDNAQFESFKLRLAEKMGGIAKVNKISPQDLAALYMADRDPNAMLVGLSERTCALINEQSGSERAFHTMAGAMRHMSQDRAIPVIDSDVMKSMNQMEASRYKKGMFGRRTLNAEQMAERQRLADAGIEGLARYDRPSENNLSQQYQDQVMQHTLDNLEERGEVAQRARGRGVVSRSDTPDM